MKTRWLINFRLMVLLAVIAVTTNACHKTPAPSSATAKQQRLDWNLKTLVQAYQDHGNNDAKWDGFVVSALTEFARARAHVTDADEPVNEIISTNIAAAVHAGCDDPLVNYIYIKYAMPQTGSREDFAKAFSKMARDMNQSSYPPIRKFYAAARTLDQTFYTYGTNARNQPIMGEIMPMLSDTLNATLADKTMPAVEAFEVGDTMLPLVSGSKSYYEQTYQAIEKPLFENWPDAYTTWLLKGKAYTQMAWDARGSGYANTVSDQGWMIFSNDLVIANQSLNHAWQLNSKDPAIPLQMMTVILGQSGGRDQMELWFNRGMELDPDNYDLCSAKLYFLEPKWYGTTDAMLEFGRECVTNQAWGGHIPLILLDAHKSIQSQYVDDPAKADYWKQPAVWADLKAAFDRFFELNPNDISWYHNYAWYAYQAEQWDTLNKIIPKLGPVNYSFFGGKDEFDKMVQLAKEHADSSK